VPTRQGIHSYDCISLEALYFHGSAPQRRLASVLWRQYCHGLLLARNGWLERDLWRTPGCVWNPQVKTSGASFGVQTNQFGFDITRNNSLMLVVEACTDLVNPVWSPVATNTLTGGSSYFSDPGWTNSPGRFYRLTMP